MHADCVLCRVVSGASPTPFEDLVPGSAPNDQVLLPGQSAGVIVDVAPIAPGHCLIVPRDHVLSVGQADPRTRAETELHMSLIRGAFRSVFKSDAVFFEHGQCSGDEIEGCGIGHAHMHAIRHEPNAAIPDLPVQVLHGGISDLPSSVNDDGYLFIQIGSADPVVITGQSIPSQFLRRHFVSDEYPSPELTWNWHDQIAFSEELGTRDRVLRNLIVLRTALSQVRPTRRSSGT